VHGQLLAAIPTAGVFSRTPVNTPVTVLLRHLGLVVVSVALNGSDPPHDMPAVHQPRTVPSALLLPDVAGSGLKFSLGDFFQHVDIEGLVRDKFL
jgi:hypothetical protein